METNPLASISLSRSQTLDFYDDFLTYKDQTFNYSEIQGISYLFTQTSNSIYLIPTHNTSSIIVKLEVNGKIYHIETSATSPMFFKGKTHKNKEEIFSKLIFILNKLIVPNVRDNLLRWYSAEKAIQIGTSLTITPQGLVKKRFLRSPEIMPWDQFHSSSLSAGYLIVNRLDASKDYRQFFSCEMSILNSVVVPDLLDYLYKYRGDLKTKHDKAIKQESDMDSEGEILTRVEDRNQPQFCGKCGGKVSADSKYCKSCGLELN